MKLGFVINPMAGIGGSVALKGSDGMAIVKQALSLGGQPQAESRAAIAMGELTSSNNISIITASNTMGENVLRSLQIDCEVVYKADSASSAEDTKNAVRLFVENNVDLIVFAGGDGTARDVLDILSQEGRSSVPVVGIPAGVKIHSAVYAITPVHAGELINLIAMG